MSFPCAHEMAACLDEDSVLVEFGSGSSVKTRFLLDAVKHSIAYFPVDVSSSHLAESAEALRDSYPEILIEPVVADFTQPFTIPSRIPADAPVTIYFPGSTIGNFEPEEAEELFQIIVSEMGGDNGALLIGIDLQKDAQVIEAAYNEKQGITAEFNLNLLHRINRELNGDLDVSQFEHRSVYNESAGRIETSIVSKCSQEAVVAGESIQFGSGEQIHTEYSYKYSIDEFIGFAARFGLAFDQSWLDSQKYFAVLRFVANGN